jgi:hypothetical protein
MFDVWFVFSFIFVISKPFNVTSVVIAAIRYQTTGNTPACGIKMNQTNRDV